MLASDPYARIPSEPFDRLIMERTKKGYVVPCSIKWSDAGSWQALWQMGERDQDGNHFHGPVVAHDVTDTFVRSDGPMVAVVGIEDVTVVATRDAVLVTPRHRSQDVKTIVQEIERKHQAIAAHHARINRPWGTYESLAEGTHFQVKHIVVHPGRQLSLQKHHHRAEHWVVVGGTASVHRDGTEELLFPNESIYVPRGAVHRLTNPGKVPLHVIEVQSGDYLGEDDIIRLDDPYGRAAEPAPLPRGDKKLGKV